MERDRKDIQQAYKWVNAALYALDFDDTDETLEEIRKEIESLSGTLGKHLSDPVANKMLNSCTTI